MKEHIRVPSRIIQTNGKILDFRIRQICDTHQDSDFFRDDVFNDFVTTQERDTNSLWLHTGDIVDFDRPTTREAKNRNYSDRRDAQRNDAMKSIKWLDEKIIPKYAKIASSCLGIIDGDHYLEVGRFTSGRYLAHKLRVPYLGKRSAYVSVIFRDTCGGAIKYDIFARHGKGGGGTPGGDMNALRKQNATIIADCYFGSHTHQQNCHPARFEYVSHKGFLANKIAWYVRGGSMLDCFPVGSKKRGYAYDAEYSSVPCGWGQVELTLAREYNGEGKAKVFSIRKSTGSIIAF